MQIEYKINEPITTDQFINRLADSTFGERRPIQGRECMDGMIANSNLTVSAWESGGRVGISPHMTDCYYACYRSDLAVAKNWRNRGLGKQLQIITQQRLGPSCKLMLIAAPAAPAYYERIGFINSPGCRVLEREGRIQS